MGRQDWQSQRSASAGLTAQPVFRPVTAQVHVSTFVLLNSQRMALPLKMVQARLGHASIQMTADRYGHLFPSTDDGTELAAAEKALMR